MGPVIRAKSLVESGWSSMDLGSMDLLLDRSISVTERKATTLPKDIHFMEVLNSSKHQRETSHNRGQIAMLSAVAMSNQVGFNIILGTLWPYLNSLDTTKPDINLSVNLVVLSIVLFSLSKTASGIVYGYIADSANAHKLLLIIAEIFSLVSFLLYVYLDSIYSSTSGDHVWIYVLTCSVRVLLGLGAGNTILIRSHIAASTSEETRGKAMAKLTFAQTAGIIMGHCISFGFSYLVPSQYIDLPYMSFTVYTAPVWIAIFWKLINIFLLLVVFKANISDEVLDCVETDTELYRYTESDKKKPDKVIIAICIMLNAFVLTAPDFISNMVSPFMTLEMNHTLEKTVKMSSITFMSSGVLSFFAIILILFISYNYIIKERKVLGISILISFTSAVILIPFQGYEHGIHFWQMMIAVGLISVATPLFKSSLATIYSKVLVSKKQGLMTALISAPLSKVLAFGLTGLYEDSGTVTPIVILVVMQAVTLVSFFICYRLLVPYDINAKHNSNNNNSVLV